MKIVFATNNDHKLSEIRSILGNAFEVLSLKDIGCDVDIPETGSTLEANALQKAEYVFDHYGLDCFADDTGLEVEALGGAPSIYTARYGAMPSTRVAGYVPSKETHDTEANTTKLLLEMKGEENRKARFRTAIALIQKQGENKTVHQFNGIVEGEITTEKRGDKGFGYDPVFQPEGYGKTFAELGVDIKNQISHRARATKKLADYLQG